MNRAEVLDTAKSLVYGERAKDYDNPRRNFKRIAVFWQEILQTSVTPEQVAICLAALKLTRLIKSPKKSDNWTDLAGYAACGAEVAEETEKDLVSVSQWGLHGE